MYGVKRVGLLLLGLGLLAGCRTAHDVAVSSFRVLDAPANFVRKRIDAENTQTTTTTTTTTTASSDTVTTPGRTVTASSPPQRRTTTTTTKPSPSPTNVTEKSKPSPSPSRSSTQGQFPTARPVPGKPGYVFSPFDPSGGYVDVTGYTSGQKVKDPYSGKIFLVP